MEDNSMDGVVTDPPFGIGFQYNEYVDAKEGYGAWIWECVSEAERIAKPGAPIFVWQAMPNITHFSEWFPRRWRIFAACKNFTQVRRNAVMQYSFDPVVVWWKEGGEPWSAKTANRDFYVANTRPSTRKVIGDYVEGHPCPRPLSQVRLIIEQWVPPGGVVLDPFMGSGTTGVACRSIGRKFVGCEIDKGYFEIAKARIESAQARERLL